jgi:hypothetical protein
VTNRDPAIANGDNGEHWIRTLPPGWRQLIELCRQIRHGELERVAIQDGVPVLVELTRQKVKFGNHR